MGKFIKGDVVVIPFPFSDLSGVKKRPAVIISSLQGDDCLLLQITSKSAKDEYAIDLSAKDFESGNINQNSNIRPNKIFTLDKNIILYKVGSLKQEKTDEIVAKIINIIKN